MKIDFKLEQKDKNNKNNAKITHARELIHSHNLYLNSFFLVFLVVNWNAKRIKIMRAINFTLTNVSCRFKIKKNKKQYVYFFFFLFG